MTSGSAFDACRVFGAPATIAPPPEPSMKIRIGDEWVDVTELGDMLIRAGTDLNMMMGRELK